MEQGMCHKKLERMTISHKKKLKRKNHFEELKKAPFGAFLKPTLAITSNLLVCI